jgi:hypothetical protein
MEHALNIDSVNEGMGVGARVTVELSADAARPLATTILAVLDRAQAGGCLESGAPSRLAVGGKAVAVTWRSARDEGSGGAVVA